jgi:hypothetical protein
MGAENRYGYGMYIRHSSGVWGNESELSIAFPSSLASEY